MSDKTEAPTPRRLEDARKEGQVARSQEINAAAALLVGLWLLTGPGKKLMADMQAMLVNTVQSLPGTEISYESLREVMFQDGLRIGIDMSVIILGLFVTGIVVSVGQTGFLWASKRIGFDFSRVNALKGLQRMFSRNGLFELIKSLFKLVLVGYIAYGFLRVRLTEILGLTQTDLAASIQFWVSMAGALAMRVASAYLVLAAVDYAYQRWQHLQGLRMSKEEVKEDIKRSEGDPFLKSRIRGMQRRMARMRMMANVPKADVIITNPTHLAIAIQYNPDDMAAPRVLAKGADLVAQRIIKLAQSHSIPTIQNIPLARAIYKTVEIDQEIPPDLYVAMAEVLAYVYKLRGASPQAAR